MGTDSNEEIEQPDEEEQQEPEQDPLPLDEDDAWGLALTLDMTTERQK